MDERTQRQTQRQISCQTFIREYSEYRDDRMSAAALATASAHLESCPSCRRYDRVVRKGVEVLRSVPEVEPRKPLTVAEIRRRAQAHPAESGRNRTSAAAGNAVATPDV